jgi:DNA-directed RNA polymerase specialized sigma subunit
MARQAVEQAARAPARLALLTADQAHAAATERAETALILLRTLLGQRTAKGWEVVDLLAGAKNQSEVAAKLGISESAVSQRLDRAGWQEGVRGAELARHLLAVAREGVQ